MNMVVARRFRLSVRSEHGGENVLACMMVSTTGALVPNAVVRRFRWSEHRGEKVGSSEHGGGERVRSSGEKVSIEWTEKVSIE